MKKVFLKTLKKYKFQYLLVFMTLVIFQIARFIPVKKMGEIIDLLSDINKNSNLIIKNFIILIVLVIIYFISRTLYKYFVKATDSRFEKDLRDEVFFKFLNLKTKDMQNIKNGELMSYITKYVNDIRAGLYGFIGYGIRNIIASGLLLSLMFSVNWKLAVIVIVPMTIEVFIANKLKDKIKNAEKDAQDNYRQMSEFVQESTDSIRTTKAFNKENMQMSIFKNKSEKVQNKYIQIGIYYALLMSSMSMCFGLCYALSFIFGIKFIALNVITIGEFIAFNAYIKDMYWPLTWIPQLITRTKKMQVAFEKLNKFYELDNEFLGNSDNTLNGDIIINNLTFSYNKNKVLKDVNITIEKGKTLGIIGTIGSGKTTIANLLLRLYDIEDGKIFINGKDINQIDIEEIRNSFCYITQTNFLFSASVKDNIKLFQDFPEKAIIESSNKAALIEDINNMKDGIDTIVGEKGITLSGGQKQRVAIARAFLTNKNFVIFDDTFSALDNKTEKIILDNLKDLLKDKTCIIISNRISDVKHADKIIVMDDGEIVQNGIHKELLLEEGLYKEFYIEQSSNEFLKETNIGEEY